MIYAAPGAAGAKVQYKARYDMGEAAQRCFELALELTRCHALSD